MFNLTDETRNAIIVILREDFNVSADEMSDEKINETIDRLIDTVKAQFGM